MLDRRTAAKVCTALGCGRPLPFPLWYHSKAKRCAVCAAKLALTLLLNE